jgi:hypothetical protein
MTTMRINPSLVTLVLLFACCCNAYAESYATILKTKNMSAYQRGQSLKIGTEIVTRENQNLALRTTSGDIFVLGPNSKIRINKSSLIKHFFGKIYFLFKPRKENPVVVQTLTATIGIRGTNFLLTTSEDDNANLISLETGLLNVASPDDQPFKVHKQKPLSEFEQFQQEQQQGMDEINQEFEDFKKQIGQEFIEYKLAVELSAGKTLRIEGRNLYTVNLPDEQQNEIDSLKEFIADVVK